MRQVALLTLAAMVCAMASAEKPRWHQLEGYTFEHYRRDFKKPYVEGEENFEVRRKAFNANVEHIKTLNKDRSMTWRAGVNMFTDMTPAEFKKYNRFRKAPGCAFKKATKVHENLGTASGSKLGLPLEVDWRQAVAPRVLTSVKHQGSCGSCWAHSATESIEAQYSFLTGMLPVLSVGQINSCTPADYNCGGCDGGDYVGAWQYLANQSIARSDVLKSVTENWAYPIPVRDWFFDTQVNYSTSACFDVSTQWKTPATSWFAELTAAGVSGYGIVDSNNATGGPTAMKALRDVGPQSISVAAGNWQWYESGVMANSNKSGSDNEWGVDHAVQLVGYGYDKELDQNYWTVRNSWSTLWGEDGFIRLWRAKDGQPEPCSPADYGPVCGTSGLLNYVAYPIVYKATPTKFG